MAKKVSARKYQPQYAGDTSKTFWRAVRQTNDDTLYVFACALQDMESRVLGVLREAGSPRVREGRDQP